MAEVILAGCRTYSRTDIAASLDDALDCCIGDRAGEIAGKRVLVKPNLLAAREPARGITTHPAVVGGVIDYFNRLGARISVGDSPAGAVRGVRRVWERSGMLEVCGARGVPLVNFEAGGSVVMHVDTRTYQISRAVIDADLVVNVAKFKTHVLTLLTGAIKNMFGCVPGFRKSALHLSYPRPDAMSRALVDIFSLVPPWVSVVDAVVAMDGNGPSSGRLRDLGFLAVGRDCVALDAALALVAGIDPARVPTTLEAYRRGLGEISPERIGFPRLKPEDLAPGDFKVPSNWKYSLIPGVVGGLVSRLVWIKPVINREACTGCGACADVCPAGAIEMAGGKAEVREKACVSCLCCHEACPAGAVGTRRSLLAGMIS
jgi:uncharacterized protein (DUF362 family)/Pyruvate/2-oxoacid:ferredoxin oxidoreductase delta subunit